MRTTCLVALGIAAGIACEGGVPRPGHGAVGSGAVASAGGEEVVGRWSMALSLHYRAFVTTEMHVSSDVSGAAWFELAADGTATACLGANVSDSSSLGRLQAHDHQDHHSHHETHELLGLEGRWTRRIHGAIAIELASAKWGSCRVEPGGLARFDPQVALGCLLDPPNHRIAGTTMVCTAARGNLYGLGIRVDVTNPPSPREGPNGPAMILARVPGVTVEFEQNDRDPGPAITVRAGAPAFREADFTPTGAPASP